MDVQYVPCNFPLKPWQRTYRSVRLILGVMFCLIFIYGFILNFSFAYSQPIPREDIIKQAKKEAEFTWYTTANVRESQKIVDAFEKRYPFIKATLFRANTETLLRKAETEARAGKVYADVLNTNVFEGNIAGTKGLFVQYRSVGVERYPEKFRDPEGYWSPIFHQYLVLGYNTAMVRKGDAPQEWHDLLNPKWKSKIGIDTQDEEWYTALIQYWGGKKAREFLQALSKQDVQFRRGHTLLAQTIVAGEFPIALVFAHRAEQMKNQGAPIEWVRTTDPIVNLLSANYLVSGAPHPNAGKLFIEFALSQEVQKLLQSLHRSPADIDVALAAGFDLKKLPLFTIKPVSSEVFQTHVKEWRSIFQMVR